MRAVPGACTIGRMTSALALAPGHEVRAPGSGGRPTLYTDALGQRIADLYAEGLDFRAIGALDGMPDQATLWRWRRDRESFAGILARAREARAEALVGQGLALVDGVKANHRNGAARVSKAREQANYRRWMAGCLDRETWGERTKLDVTGQIGVLTAFVDMAQRARGAPTTPEALPPVNVPDTAYGDDQEHG